MRVLALDLGERRIGLAVSDELGLTAQGLPTLERAARFTPDVTAEDPRLLQAIDAELAKPA